MSQPRPFVVESHGPRHAQFFSGVGVPPAFAHVATGCGSSARAAGEDALEQLWQFETRPLDPKWVEALEGAVRALSEEEYDHADCMTEWLRVGNQEAQFEEAHTDCEIHHYVSIYWR